MLNWIRKMHEEGDGSPSNMRVLASIVTINSCLFMWFHPEQVQICSVLIGSVIGLKYAQTFNEVK